MKKTLLTCMLILANLSAVLYTQGYVIRNLHVEMRLSKEGTLEVTENYEVEFNERRRGIIRSIPYRFSTESGEKVETTITNINVPNHQFKTNRKNDIISIRIGNPDRYLTGLQKYQISYQVNRPLVAYENRTELLWNISGHNWDTDILSFSYEFFMPDDFILPDEDMVILTGRSGSPDNGKVSIQKVGSVIKGTSSGILNAGEGVTLALNLPPDYLEIGFVEEINNQSAREENGQDEKPKDYFYWFLGLLGAAYGWFYKKYGRNKHVSGIVETYYPPEGMSAPEVGTFYDYQAHTRDLISLLPKWGNQGIVEINSIPTRDDDRDMYFVKKKEISADAPQYEKTMFEGLFQDDNQVFLSNLKEKYYTVLGKAKAQVKKEVRDSRLYDEMAVRYFHSNWNLLAGILLILSAILVFIKFQTIFSGILLVLLGIVLIVVRFLRPKLSEEGLELHNRLVALKMFLQSPDPEKINELMKENNQYLDYIFPYVVAFGLDKSWTDAMNKTEYHNYIPPWYIYQSNNHTSAKPGFNDFAASFDIPVIQSVFSSAPVSTTGSGSGSFSGGSSGGGFGGGGGSSW